MQNTRAREWCILPSVSKQTLFDALWFAKLEWLHRLGLRAAARRQREPRVRSTSVSGVVFAGHRPYETGDDLRSLDWNHYARHERLLVRLREPERPGRLWLVLDATASTGAGAARPQRAFDTARRITLALAILALRRGASAGLLVLGGTDPLAGTGTAPLLVASQPGRGQVGRLRNLLERLRPAGDMDVQRLAAPLRAIPPARRGHAVVISDFLASEEPQDLLRPLLRSGFVPAVIELTDSTGLGRDSAVRDSNGSLCHLVDAEAGDTLDLPLDKTVLAAHARLRGQRSETLARFCRRRGFPRITSTLQAPFEQTVLAAVARDLIP